MSLSQSHLIPLDSPPNSILSLSRIRSQSMAYHHPIPGPGSGSGSSSSSSLHFLNSPSGDTTFTKVFVGGLAWETQSETLRRHFEQYGEILEAVVISDKNTGRSKGYGFVSVSWFGSPLVYDFSVEMFKSLDLLYEMAVALSLRFIVVCVSVALYMICFVFLV